ncbi:hypothetical protein ES695_01050 [Candidatus Atribacteria bacterium 1244-E10-H5-B2]|nr:MAG: hypothetical protein ES695_01050 [Candidatus Atribacteria bacterium 1244-E10-H5-B2]
MSKEIIVLLPLTLIEKSTTISCTLEFDRIAFSLDVGNSYFLHRFNPGEWSKFVNGINETDKRLKEIKKNYLKGGE